MSGTVRIDAGRIRITGPTESRPEPVEKRRTDRELLDTDLIRRAKTKVCNICGKRYPRGQFSKVKVREDHKVVRRNQCKRCEQARIRSGKNRRLSKKVVKHRERVPHERHTVPEGTGKVCTRCRVEQSFNSFYSHTSSADGLHYYCKACMSDTARVRYQKVKDGVHVPRPKPVMKHNKKKTVGTRRDKPTGELKMDGLTEVEFINRIRASRKLPPTALRKKRKKKGKNNGQVQIKIKKASRLPDEQELPPE